MHVEDVWVWDRLVLQKLVCRHRCNHCTLVGASVILPRGFYTTCLPENTSCYKHCLTFWSIFSYTRWWATWAYAHQLVQCSYGTSFHRNVIRHSHVHISGTNAEGSVIGGLAYMLCIFCFAYDLHIWPAVVYILCSIDCVLHILICCKRMLTFMFTPLDDASATLYMSLLCSFKIDKLPTAQWSRRTDGCLDLQGNTRSSFRWGLPSSVYVCLVR